MKTVYKPVLILGDKGSPCRKIGIQLFKTAKS
jgi:hypothetical protein